MASERGSSIAHHAMAVAADVVVFLCVRQPSLDDELLVFCGGTLFCNRINDAFIFFWPRRLSQMWTPRLFGDGVRSVSRCRFTVGLFTMSFHVVCPVHLYGQSQLLEEKVRELLDCHDQLEVAREAEEEYERRLDEEEAKGRRRVHALEVSAAAATAAP